MTSQEGSSVPIREMDHDDMAGWGQREVDVDKVKDALDPHIRALGDNLSSASDLVSELSADELLDWLHRAGLLRIPAPVPNSDQAVFHCPGRVAAGPGSKPVCGEPDWNHDEHDYPAPPSSRLRPTHGDPHDAESLDGCESIGWDLSWGFRLNVGHDTAEDPTSPLTIGACFSDSDQANGIVVRETTPEQLEEFARLLLNVAAKQRARTAPHATCELCRHLGHAETEHPLPKDHPQYDAFYDATDDELAGMVSNAIAPGRGVTRPNPARCVASKHIPTTGATCSVCGASGMQHEDDHPGGGDRG